MPNNEQCYDVAAIRKLLTNGLDDSSLDALCQTHFLKVYNRFGRGMGKDEKIKRLLEYCNGVPEQRFKKLLEAVQQEDEELVDAYGPYCKPCDDDPPTHEESLRGSREVQPPSGGISIESRIGGNVVQGQVGVGIGNTLLQHSPKMGDLIISPTPTETNHPDLLSKLADVKAQVEAEAPPEKNDSAIERIDELVEAITAQNPDLDTIGYVKGWFAKNIPALAEAINSIITDPTTSELITAADEGLGAEFKRRFG